ncbi:MAG: ribosome maturation factor RimP [Eubacterium sp.]|nr:ribosome maturation factor RimP [Eubacterium sp.]
MKVKDIEEKTTALILPILEKEGLSLWDVEYVKEGKDMYLRAYIDKEGGVTIDDCVNVSRALEEELDREDFISEAYILEVSSPGLTRQLKKTKDFERCVGKRIEVRTFQQVKGLKDFEAVLLDGNDEEIRIKTDDEEEISIARGNLARVRLCFVE